MSAVEPLKVVFFGSPEYAILPMKEIERSERLHLAAVVTQPDRPSGRGRRLQPPPVKEEALSAGVEVLQPRSIRGRHVAWGLEAYCPDFFAVFAYGKILPPRLLKIPRLGCVNLHLSLLPSYRGASPVSWALINGEQVTGVTTMLMDEGLDTGPALLSEEIGIDPNETAGRLTTRLSEIGARLLVRTLIELAEGKISPAEQDESKATYAPMLKKEDGLVDWSRPADQIFNRWRGLDPWPGIFSHFREDPIRLLKVAPAAGEPGTTADAGVLQRDGNRLFISCGLETRLEILDVQLPGRKPISAADFVNGYRLQPGERLGQRTS
jgi:methionyl-tRNA formyltransferase